MIKLIKIMEKYYPELTTKLVPANNESILNEIEAEIGEKLPKSFRALYEKYDGEDLQGYLGLVLGFSLMSAKDILDDIRFYKNESDVELTSMTPGVMKEEAMHDRVIIPFGFDASRCYVAMDLSPGPKGTKGQIISLDFDYDQSYLLGKNINEFCDFAVKMMEEGKCVLEDDEEGGKYFAFESGHLLNDIENLLSSGDDVQMIDLPEGFWQEYLKCESISVDELAKKKDARIWANGEKISFEPIKYMTNLREIVLICQVSDEELEVLAGLPNLKEVIFSKIELSSVEKLKESKTLKALDFYKVKGYDFSELSQFTKLQELRLDDVELNNIDFLHKLVNLKKLKINNVPVDNLDFFENMKKLNEFTMYDKVEDESGLQYVSAMKNLKSFEYPVTDMMVYKGLEKLKTAGMDGMTVTNIDVFEGTNISSICVVEAGTETRFEAIVDEVKKYVKLTSYMHVGDLEEDEE